MCGEKEPLSSSRIGESRGEGTSKKYYINEQIRSAEVRVVDADGKQLGVISVSQALQIAGERELDLVEVSPQAVPPVCRIMDFGRFRYEQSKKDRETHKKRKSQHLKEVKLRPKIDPHDFATKSKLINRLLQEGDKVKVSIWFRGREIVYAEHGKEILANVVSQASESGIVERPPKLEGKSMIMILAPKIGGRHA